MKLSQRRMTFAAVPASRTSNPAPLGNSTLSPGSTPPGSVPTAVTIPVRAPGLGACGDDQAVAGLSLVVTRLDDDVVVEQFEGHNRSLCLLEHESRIDPEDVNRRRAKPDRRTHGHGNRGTSGSSGSSCPRKIRAT